MKKLIGLLLCFSISLPNSCMEVLPLTITAAQMLTAVTPAVYSAAIIGCKYLASYYSTISPILYKQSAELLQSAQNLQLIQQAYPQAVFQQAMNPNLLLDLGARQSMLLTTEINIPMEVVNETLINNHLQIQSMARSDELLRARINVPISSPPNSIISPTITFQNAPTCPNGFSLEITNQFHSFQIPEAIRQDLSAQRLQATEKALQFLALMKNQVTRSQLIESMVKNCNLIVRSLQIANNPELIELQRSISAIIAPEASQVQRAWEMQVWPELSKLLYYSDGSFKGLQTVAEIEKAVQSLEPYFQNYHDLIGQEKYIDFLKSNQHIPGFKILLERATHTNTWADWSNQLLAKSGSSIKDMVGSRPQPVKILHEQGFNSDLKQMLDYCRQRDFASARAIQQKYSGFRDQISLSHKKQLDVIYKHFSNQQMVEHDILNFYTLDPIYPQIKAHLDSLKNTSEYLLAKENDIKTLVFRFEDTKNFLSSCNVKIENAHPELIKCGYDLVGLHPQIWPQYFEAKFNINPELIKISQPLFESNGFIKGLTIDKQLTQFEVPSIINALENGHIKILANKFAVLDRANPIIKNQVAQCMNAIKYALKTNNIAAKNIYIDHANSVYHAITNPAADQCILKYNLITENTRLAFEDVYKNALDLAVKAEKKLIQLEMSQGYKDSIEQISAILDLEKAKSAIDALNTGNFIEYKKIMAKAQISSKEIDWTVQKIKGETTKEIFSELISSGSLVDKIKYELELQNYSSMETLIAELKSVQISHPEIQSKINETIEILNKSTASQSKQAYLQHAKNISYILRNPKTADQRLLRYNFADIQLNAQTQIIYDKVMQLVARAGTKLARLDHAITPQASLEQIQATLQLDAAEQAIQALKANDLVEAEKILSQIQSTYIRIIKEVIDTIKIRETPESFSKIVVAGLLLDKIRNELPSYQRLVQKKEMAAQEKEKKNLLRSKILFPLAIAAEIGTATPILEVAQPAPIYRVEQENVPGNQGIAHFPAPPSNNMPDDPEDPENEPNTSNNKHHFSEEQIEEGVKFVMQKWAKFTHIFGDIEHKLEPFIRKVGGEENATRLVIKALSGKINYEGVFEDIMVQIESFEIYVRGRVMQGVPKLGTFFIK